MKRFAAAASLALVMTTLSACSASPTAPPGPAPQPQPTYVLSGFVIADAPGPRTPVAGAQVIVDAAFGRTRMNVVTDDNGMYRVSGLPHGSASISTSKSGYATNGLVVTMTGDRQLDIQIVPADTHTLSGFVFEMTPEGRAPVEGAWLHWSELHLDATSDAKGFYSLTVFSGNSPFLASKEGYLDTMKQVSMVEDRRLDIELVKP